MGYTEAVGPAAMTGQADVLAEPPPSAGAVHPWRRRLLLAARLLVVLAIGYFVVHTSVQQWPYVRKTFHDLSWTAIAVSFLGALLAITATPMSWRRSIEDLDHPVPVTSAGQVFLVGQLGKYLPGSVWSYVLQMELGRRAGIPRARSFLASLIATGLGITTGLLLGTLALPAMWRAAHGNDHPGLARVLFVSAIVLLPVALACAHPRVLTRLVRIFLRILRREPLERPLSWRGVLGTMLWSAIGYVFFALHLWLLARSQAPVGWGGLVASLAAVSLAVGVSTVVVIAPSGLGVREFIIAITLTGFGVPYGAGFAIALASRLIVTVADVVAAGGAALLAVRRLHRSG